MSKVILVVEDEADFRQVVVEILEGANYTVLEASQGKEALDILSKNKVDLVLSDIRMPKMDGMELLKHIQEIDHDKPQVIMMTGFSVYTQEEAIKAGALNLVEKPGLAKELLHILSAIRFY